MEACIVSDILNKISDKKVIVRIQTASHSVYEGRIDSIDCMGILFVPTDTAKYDPAYIMFNDIRKFIIPK